jgi:hypothetical protein
MTSVTQSTSAIVEPTNELMAYSLDLKKNYEYFKTRVVWAVKLTNFYVLMPDTIYYSIIFINRI